MFSQQLRSRQALKCAVAICAVSSIGAMYVGLGTGYQQQNLVTDGFYEAPTVDPNLVNPWGLVPNPNGVWWISDEATGKSTLYDGDGNTLPLVVDVPAPNFLGSGEPTGIAFNSTQSFVMIDGPNSAPALFLFAGIDGVISGWAPTLPPPAPSTAAHVVIDSSGQGAGYFGVAINTFNPPRLYAADFFNARINGFDGTFQPLTLPGTFTDPAVPAGYAPFNIMSFGEHLFVAYALKDAQGEEVPGPGNGFVSVFTRNGALVSSLIRKGKLNAPWGMAMSPGDFGQFSNCLLVGNFGDGRINAYDPLTGHFRGTLLRANGRPIHADGLWGMSFGNGAGTSPSNVLHYTAGPADEAHGVFGRIDSL